MVAGVEVFVTFISKGSVVFTLVFLVFQVHSDGIRFDLSH